MRTAKRDMKVGKKNARAARVSRRSRLAGWTPAIPYKVGDIVNIPNRMGMSESGLYRILSSSDKEAL